MTTDNVPDHHGVEDTSGRSYPNETMRLLIERASCRNFADKKILPEVLNLVLEAGLHAPTGGNLQPYSIIKIERQETKAKLEKLCGSQPFIKKAPINLVFCIDWRRIQRWAELEVAPFTATNSFRHFWISFQDTIACAQNICTAADAMGLGSVYVGTSVDRSREIRDLLGLPQGVFAVVLLCLGYPQTTAKPRKKLGVDVVVHDEQYHELADEVLVDAYNKKYPDVKVTITDERLAIIATVCRSVHGKEFTDRCIARIKEQGYINPVQRYFGLHYPADEMPEGNNEFLAIVEEFGFNWFKKWLPNPD